MAKRTTDIHRGAAALCLLACVCHHDPTPRPGVLTLHASGERLGDTSDALGVLVFGQAVCGTHVAVRSEAGTFSLFGGDRVTGACLALPTHELLQAFELEVYPTATAALLHAQLWVDPRTCPRLPADCRHLCTEDADDPLAKPGPIVSAACPAAALVGQVTLLVPAEVAADGSSATVTSMGTDPAEMSTGSTTSGSTGSTTSGSTGSSTDGTGTTSTT